MGSTEIIAVIVVAVAIFLIVAYYLTASTKEFEEGREQAEENPSVEVDVDPAAAPDAHAVDASARSGNSGALSGGDDGPAPPTEDHVEH